MLGDIVLDVRQQLLERLGGSKIQPMGIEPLKRIRQALERTSAPQPPEYPGLPPGEILPPPEPDWSRMAPEERLFVYQGFDPQQTAKIHVY